MFKYLLANINWKTLKNCWNCDGIRLWYVRIIFNQKKSNYKKLGIFYYHDSGGDVMCEGGVGDGEW